MVGLRYYFKMRIDMESIFYRYNLKINKNIILVCSRYECKDYDIKYEVNEFYYSEKWNFKKMKNEIDNSR